VIESIAINPDGTYADEDQFRAGLEEKMIGLGLPEHFRDELRSLLDPAKLLGPVIGMTKRSFEKMRANIATRREQLAIQFAHKETT
jgi:hypothetical protein